MRKIVLVLLVFTFVLGLSSVGFADLDQFSGTWVNVDPNTQGITKLDIQVNGSKASVQAWGKCTPNDCDWGRVQAKVYATKIYDNLETSAIAISAVFTYATIENFILVKPMGNQLKAELLTTYSDGRSNRYSVYEFRPLEAVSETPTQISPAHGSVFRNFPRTTTLQWSAAAGASSYTVEIDCFSCCKAGSWCADIGKPFKVVTGLTGTNYTFDFVGAQPGRWRVWAVSSNGTPSAKSGWWEFRYTK